MSCVGDVSDLSSREICASGAYGGEQLSIRGGGWVEKAMRMEQWIFEGNFSFTGDSRDGRGDLERDAEGMLVNGRERESVSTVRTPCTLSKRQTPRVRDGPTVGLGSMDGFKLRLYRRSMVQLLIQDKESSAFAPPSSIVAVDFPP